MNFSIFCFVSNEYITAIPVDLVLFWLENFFVHPKRILFWVNLSSINAKNCTRGIAVEWLAIDDKRKMLYPNQVAILPIQAIEHYPTAW